MDASIVVVLQGGPEQAERCFASLGELPDEPSFEVVVVDDASVGLDDLLARLGGDVTVVRAPQRAGASAALALGLERCTGDHVVLLRGAPCVAPTWLAPLVGALADGAVSAAASVTDGEPAPAAVATHALAVRRADLDAIGGLPPAPDGLELAALVAALA